MGKFQGDHGQESRAVAVQLVTRGSRYNYRHTEPQTQVR
jgi:hypothetical protein